MSKISKKIIVLIMSVLFILSSSICFAGCKDKKPIIGIIQFGTHGSLNNCYTGILDGLEENIDLSKYQIKHFNSNFDASTSLAQAKNLVNSKAEVIIAIATPSAIQAATAATGKNIPVVYCAVTDASQLNNFANITGTSDIPDFNMQLQLVTSFMEKTNVKIGVLMSTEESSDEIQISTLKEEAKKFSGMEIIEEVVADITTIDTKVETLINKNIDCIVNLLDNTIVSKLQNILVKTNNKKIPVFGSEVEQVKNGCLASASIDYITVGKLAGGQAAQILNGKKASEVAKRTMENQTFNCYNSTVLNSFSDICVFPTNIIGLQDVIEA